jgi:hypothetical protein
MLILPEPLSYSLEQSQAPLRYLQLTHSCNSKSFRRAMLSDKCQASVNAIEYSYQGEHSSPKTAANSA